MGELGIGVTAILKEDASACIGLATRLGPGRMKHLEIRHLVLQRWVADKKLKIEKVKTTEQLADVLTKPYQKSVLHKLGPRLGLIIAFLPGAWSIEQCDEADMASRDDQVYLGDGKQYYYGSTVILAAMMIILIFLLTMACVVGYFLGRYMQVKVMNKRVSDLKDRLETARKSEADAKMEIEKLKSRRLPVRKLCVTHFGECAHALTCVHVQGRVTQEYRLCGACLPDLR